MLALVAVPLSACLGAAPGGLPADDSVLPLPTPRINATYVYHDKDRGERLAARIVGVQERVDGYGRTHRVLVINWTWSSPRKGGHGYRFQEAVDLDRGLVVQHVARCGVPRPDEPSGCMDERALVLLSGGGLPGAFGAGPLWSAPTGAEEVEVDVAPVFGDRETVSYNVSEADGPCRRLAAEPPSTRVRSFAQAVVAGPMVVCADRSLPVRFDPLGDRVGGIHDRGPYELVEVEPGGAQIALDGEADAWNRSRSLLGMREWRDPVVVDPTVSGDSAPARFPAGEAHGPAMNLSLTYRRMFSEEDALLASTFAHWDGGGGSPESEATQHRVDTRRLVAVVPSNGSAYEVWISRRSQAGDRAHAYYVKDEGWASWPYVVPDRSSLATEQAAVEDAFALAKRIAGNPVRSAGQHAGAPAHTHVTVQGRQYYWMQGTRWRGLQDGLTIQVEIDEPQPREQDNGIRVVRPYPVIFDARTGALLSASLNRTRLPIEQWI